MAEIRELNIQYITNENGQKTGVILAIEEFESLMEDFADILVLLEQEDEETISHEALLAELAAEDEI